MASTSGSCRASQPTIMPMPMLNARSISSSLTPPPCWRNVKTGGTRQRALRDRSAGALGQDARQVLGDPAARDVRHALHELPVDERLHRAQIAAVRHQQRVADRGAELGHVAVERQSEPLEHDPARQRVAVGVQAGRRDADEHVARHERRSVDHAAAFDEADDEAGEVVFAVGVEARHLRRLAAQQRAAVLSARLRHPTDDLFRDLRLRAVPWRGSRGRTAAARPAPGCRSRSGSRGPGRPCRDGRP